MSLTYQQRITIQATFAQVADADALASRFYAQLFAIDPSTQPLFTGDMAEQRKKLIQVLSVVVNSLHDLSAVVPAIESLGKRHVTYGVTIEHWSSVGNALLWALEDTFGAAYTANVHEAWAAAYNLIAQTAIAAAYPATQPS